MFCIHVSASDSRGCLVTFLLTKFVLPEKYLKNIAGKIQEGFFQYDPRAMSWTQISAAGSEAPVHRIGPGFASAVGRIFLFGGDSVAGKNVLLAGRCV